MRAILGKFRVLLKEGEWNKFAPKARLVALRGVRGALLPNMCVKRAAATRCQQV